MAVQDSLSPVMILLCQMFCHLKLHNEEIHTASSDELNDFWFVIIAIDATLSDRNAVYRQETMNQHQQVIEFIILLTYLSVVNRLVVYVHLFVFLGTPLKPFTSSTWG